MEKYGVTAASIPADLQDYIMTDMGGKAGFNAKFANMFNSIPNDAMAGIINGDVYKDGKGLDARIWSMANMTGNDIQQTVLAGLSRGQSAVDMAKELEQYVDPSKRKYGAPSNKLIGASSGAEYNSLRMARTTNTHASTLSNKMSCKKNPFIEGLKWNLSNNHSTRMHGHTDSCDSNARHNGDGIFAIDDYPFEHPNGLCYPTPAMSTSTEDAAQQLHDWANGGTNTTLDKWYAENGADMGGFKPLSDVGGKAAKIEKERLAKIEADKVEAERIAKNRANYERLKAEAKAEKERLQAIADAKEAKRLARLAKAKKGDPYANMTKKFEKALTNSSEQINKSIKEAPKFMRDFYAKNDSNLKFLTTDAKRGAYYSENSKSICINLAKDAEGPQGKFAVFHHEFGHLMDDAGAKVTTSPGLRDVRTLMSDNAVFKDAIEKDMLTKLRSYGKDLSITDKYSEISKELREDMHVLSGVSDAYSGLTLNKVQGGYAHSTDYWTRGNQMSEVASETFANMTAAYMDPKVLEGMQKWFPKACKAYEKIVKASLI